MGRTELVELMQALIIDVKQEDKQFIFSDFAKSIIEKVARYSESTDLYKSKQAEFTEFWSENSDMDASAVYMHMLAKIAKAPTVLHALGSVILVMPHLNNLLKNPN